MPSAKLKQTTLPVTSKYGPRILNGRNNVHKGTDFPFGKNTPVSAFGAGVVTHAGRGTGGNAERGIYVEISHAPGIGTSYHSLSRVTVAVGQSVGMGDTIGYGGRTATGATGDHCHVGLWINGSHVNLENYLTPGQVVTLNLNGGTISVGDSAPFDNTPKPYTGKKDYMYIHADTNGTYWFVSDKGWQVIPDPQTRDLLRRMISGSEHTFNQTEVTMMNSFVQGKAYKEVPREKDTEQLLGTLRGDLAWLDRDGPNSNRKVLDILETGVPVDLSTVRKEITEAIAAAPISVDYQALAKAVADELHSRIAE